MKYLAAILFMATLTARGQTQLSTKIEPIDVPPISEEYGNLGTKFCDMGQCTWVDYDKNSAIWGETMKPYRRTVKTCADKTRFLMTSEDGNKHCIRLTPSTKESK